MNSNLFNTDYVAIAKEIIRPRHRAGNQSSYIAALHYPLRYLNELFYSFRESIFYTLAHDSRKISIEKVLNDKFDPDSRRITISNLIPEPYPYLYEEGDNKPLYLYELEDNKPVHLPSINDVDTSSVNFIVRIPSQLRALGSNEQRNQEILINSQVNKYKLAGKNHRLLWTN